MMNFNAYQECKQPITIDNGNAYIYKFDGTLIHNKSQFITKFKLSKKEKERISRYKFVKDQFLFGIGRSILKLILNDLNVTSYKIGFGVFGKPFIQDYPEYKFSISHSGSVVLLAINIHHDLGVDIEVINNNIDHIQIGETVFSKDEMQVLNDVNTPKKMVESFYKCWTKKEAYIKAIGKGLNAPLKLFSVDILDEGNRQRLQKVEWQKDDKNNWQISNFDVNFGYDAALCCHTKIKEVYLFDINQRLLNELNK